MDRQDQQLRPEEEFQRLLLSEYKLLKDTIRVLDLELKHKQENHTESQLFFKREAPLQQEEKYFRYRAASPWLVKNSLYLTSYSFWEYSFKKLCMLIAFQYPEHEKPIRNFEKLYQYYSWLCNLLNPLPDEITNSWKTLNFYRETRNYISHHNSSLPSDATSASVQFIKNAKGLMFTEPDSFHIADIAFVLDFLELSEQFMSGLLDEYKKKM